MTGSLVLEGPGETLPCPVQELPAGCQSVDPDEFGWGDVFEWTPGISYVEGVQVSSQGTATVRGTADRDELGQFLDISTNATIDNGSHTRMGHRSLWRVTRVDEVAGTLVVSFRGRHGPDDSHLMCHFGQLGKMLRYFETWSPGGDSGKRPTESASWLWIKGINVAHPSLDLQEDDSLGLAEPVSSSSWSDRGQVWQNGKPEGPVCASFYELTSR